MKRTLIILLFIISLLVLGMVMHGCSKDEPQFNLLGNWVGLEWNCSDRQNCGYSQEDQDESDIRFKIQYMHPSGKLDISEGKRFIPSCEADPYCTANDWHADSASFVNSRLYIYYTTGHVYTGNLEGEEFVGKIDYWFGNDNEYHYDWGKEIRIVKAIKKK